MRFVFSPPTEEAAGLLSLPWTEPLEEWHDPRLVEIRQRGISRHIVRFVADDGELYALKAINENLARREYRLLRELAELNVPAVHVVGIVVDRGRGSRRDPGHPVPGLLHAPTGRSSPARAAASRRTGCSTPWSSSWSGCTCPVSSGATARYPTRCSAMTRARSRRTWSTRRRASGIPR